ncbi:ABC transporter permease [Paenibacillus sp. OV219]|uniref:ABC transporter permease n=1 Tax=Paenibacillus sp. OV219 TaxID=1884377 RepID=UPI0008CBE099|nr:ABC transporter permease subunit [Paenibacillus sp. OV219]SEO68636.1 ABC-2 type transport system permease protein [Paenibacillus sp. OV219]
MKKGLRQWFVLYRKEQLELFRSYKLLWVPLVFILYGAMQPVMSYFLPDILAHAGNLPPGAVISIPKPSASEVMAQTLGQFNTIGVLILSLSVMGIISAERTSGLTSMILVKPVSYFSFVTAKWAAMTLLVITAFAGGFGAALYYTTVLFHSVDWQYSLYAYLLFSLWLCLAGSLTLFFSSWLRSGAAAAGCALGVAAMLALTASAFPHELAFSPGMLPHLAYSQYDPAASEEPLAASVVTTLVLILALLTAASALLRKRPSLDAL